MNKIVIYVTLIFLLISSTLLTGCKTAPAQEPRCTGIEARDGICNAEVISTNIQVSKQDILAENAT